MDTDAWADVIVLVVGSVSPIEHNFARVAGLHQLDRFRVV
jgi:hypothetical protein